MEEVRLNIDNSTPYLPLSYFAIAKRNLLRIMDSKESKLVTSQMFVVAHMQVKNLELMAKEMGNEHYFCCSRQGPSKLVFGQGTSA